jgi:amino acid transporter
MTQYAKIKRLLVGKPIASKHAHKERLIKIFGLPVFASDAISSTAYATEEVLLVLVTAVTATAYYDLFPISLALAALLLIVAFSYYQTIHAYPEGGGSYSVSKENLGSVAGRIAAAALLIDYVLTVSVSVSSGVAALVSAYPRAQGLEVPIACLVIVGVALMNLRGARESGIVFAIPTYAFVFMTLAMIVAGVMQGWGKPNHPPSLEQSKMIHDVTWFFVLRGFAGICAAMTGVEAVSNGVQAFRPPESRNASITLVWMAGLLMVMVVGVSWCAQHFGLVPMHPEEHGYKTIMAQLAEHVFGQGWFFYGIQTATMLILFLAANTSFADFPRLSSFIARDKYLPRQLRSLGDRLVYQNGIILLAVVSMLLVIVFKASTHLLIPLYAVGVFTAFTMSQTGMVFRWIRLKKYGFGIVINGIGALATGVVTLVIAGTKFEEGAWLVVVAVAAVMFVFAKVKKYYDYLAKEFEVAPTDTVREVRSRAILLVPRLHRGTLEAIAYAKSTAGDVRALHVAQDAAGAESLRAFWREHASDIPLVVLDAPYRSLVEPVTEYVDQALEDDPDAFITVIVPQGVPPKWYQAALHSNLATALKLALASRRRVVVTNVRYFLD